MSPLTFLQYYIIFLSYHRYDIPFLHSFILYFSCITISFSCLIKGFPFLHSLVTLYFSCIAISFSWLIIELFPFLTFHCHHNTSLSCVTISYVRLSVNE